MEQRAVILFDGICNLCNHTVQFIIKNDPKKKFLFSSLQSDTGIDLLKKHGLPTTNFQSFVLIENGLVYTKSTAALKIALQLKRPLPLLYGFILVPSFIRDFFYSLISKNRYRWFGKNSVCMIPDPSIVGRFI